MTEEIIFELEDDLDEQFRKIVVDVNGLHRGVIPITLEETIKDWTKRCGKKK